MCSPLQLDEGWLEDERNEFLEELNSSEMLEEEHNEGAESTANELQQVGPPTCALSPEMSLVSFNGEESAIKGFDQTSLIVIFWGKRPSQMKQREGICTFSIGNISSLENLKTINTTQQHPGVDTGSSST